MAARYFVFVEFSDPEIRDFLERLRVAFFQAPQHDTPHITVRGPYSKPPDPKLIENLSDGLHGQGVLIADVGVFETNKGFSVFLHAKSRIFDDIWWKPDFSGPSYRKLPHVTLYETKSRDKANLVADFLRSESAEIVTYGVELTVYTSKQRTLLAAEESLPTHSRRFPQERIDFRTGIFERAEELGVYLKDGSEHDRSQKNLF